VRLQTPSVHAGLDLFHLGTWIRVPVGDLFHCVLAVFPRSARTAPRRCRQKIVLDARITIKRLL
jgi:hypothetical protein